ncbi:hypothetical protein [Hymenobacter sp. BRD67]|uniref:hypothetical protein n=1 Tax=Hymenobacter sp. BRD67 TaxID=2675877 RepID=UPI0015678FDD|nr:hypothetical protein [Hymenobacter sp. BRD67]QKG51734.1 hypothetical protein GKZ67_02900 [Hymenobacter sp. BRD67]
MATGGSEVAAISTTATEATRNLSPAPPAPTEFELYYDDSHKDLRQALDWMTQTNALDPKFWNVYTEARIRLKMNDYQGAIEAAQHSKQLALATTPPNLTYAHLDDALIAEAQRQAQNAK